MVREAFIAPAHSEKQTQDRGWSHALTSLPLGISAPVMPRLTMIPGSTCALATSPPVLSSLEERSPLFADETDEDREENSSSRAPKKDAHQLGNSAPGHLSPMQLGWVPLHVPSDWQNLRGEPTSTRGGWQEKETEDL